MKSLKYLVLIALIVLFASYEGGDSKNRGSKQNDPVWVIVPDSGLLKIDLAQLEKVRCSNLSMFQQSKLLDKYQDAIHYNIQYRLLNDSILKVKRNREIVEIRAAYGHETGWGTNSTGVRENTRADSLANCIECISGVWWRFDVSLPAWDDP